MGGQCWILSHPTLRLFEGCAHKLNRVDNTSHVQVGSLAHLDRYPPVIATLPKRREKRLEQFLLGTGDRSEEWLTDVNVAR